MKNHKDKPNPSNLPKKTQKLNNTKLDDSLEDSSLDEVFRFDDKLIGKRTNTVFEVKPVDDGFFDIVNDNLNSKMSFESEDLDKSSQIFQVYEMSEMDQKKNEKMIRLISTLQNEPDGSLTEIQENEDITDESESQKKGRSKLKDQDLSYKSVRVSNKLNKTNLSYEGDDIPTRQKKSKLSSRQDQDGIAVGVDQQKSTKSKVSNTQEIIDTKPQKVQTNNQNVVKVDKKFKDKNEINEKRQQERQKDIKKEQKHIPIDFNKNQRRKSGKSSTEIIQTSINILRLNVKDPRRSLSPIPQNKLMKKRGLPPKPAKGRNEEEEEEEYNPQKKFILPINFQKPKAGDEYEPLGRGPVERYPKRLRIPPLRFWQNERKHYDRGFLSSITLIDDDQGRYTKNVIEGQLDNIIP